MSNSEQTTKAEQTAEKPKLTPEQREAQRKQALDDAAKKAVSSATNLRAYLAVQSRFERYSTNNNLLIFAQRPDATRLKSLELWNKEKKWIREGAKAVAIYEPVRKQGKDGKTYTRISRPLARYWSCLRRERSTRRTAISRAYSTKCLAILRGSIRDISR